MNKIFAFAMVVVVLLSLSSVSFANMQHKNLLLENIVMVEDELPVFSSITIENDRLLDFDNGKIVLSIPELGVRASKKVSINDGSRDTTHVVLDIPEDAPFGDYWVRVVVTNEDVRRIRHRLITIE